MNPKRRALGILAAEVHGYPVEHRCTTCGDARCDRNFPDPEALSWARGVVVALEVPIKEIQAVIDTVGDLMGEDSLKRR